VNQYRHLTSAEVSVYAHVLADRGRFDDVAELLLDLDWLETKLIATSVAALEADFGLLPPGRESLRLVRDAISISGHIVREHNHELVSQLLARIDFSAVPDLHPLRDQLRCSHRTALRPLFASLTTPPGLLLRTYSGHKSSVTCAQVTPDGRWLVSTSLDGTATVWDVTTGLPVVHYRRHAAYVTALAVDRSSHYVFSGSEDGMLKSWAVKTGSERYSVQAHPGGILALAMAADGQLIISGEGAQGVQTSGGLAVWDAQSGALLRRLLGHREGVAAICALPNGRIVSASHDGSLCVWDVNAASPVATLDACRGRVSALAVASDGRRAIASYADLRVVEWDLVTYTALSVSGQLSWPVTALGLSAHGSLTLAGTLDGELLGWDSIPPGVAPSLSVQAHGESVTAIAVLPDGQRCISASEDGSIRLWALGRSAQVPEVPRHFEMVNAILITVDGRYVVSASGSEWESKDNTLIVWSTETGEVLHILEGASEQVLRIAVLPDQRRLASLTEFGYAAVWDMETGQVLDRRHDRALQEVPGAFEIWVHSISEHGPRFGDSGPKRHVYAAADRRIRVRDLASGTDIPLILGEAIPVSQKGFRTRRIIDHNGIAVTRDGRHALIVVEGNVVKLWDLDSARALIVLPALPTPIYAVALTTNARLAVLGSRDGAVCLWDLRAHKALATFHGEAAITACAISPDGRTIAAGEASGRVHILRRGGH
jgi:WD40 repeat protein